MNAEERNSILRYCFGNEIQYLQKIGSTLEKDANIVMLGVGPAIMALALLEGTQHPVNLWGIDIQNFTGKAHLEDAGYKDSMICLEGYSWNFSEQFEDNFFDLLIVDAAHDAISVGKDIRVWWKKVKLGGIVFFHDYIPLEKDNGVKQAIELHRDLFWKELARPGISIVYQKLA